MSRGPRKLPPWDSPAMLSVLGYRGPGGVWEKFGNSGLERLSEPVFDTAPVYSGATQRINFFDERRPPGRWYTNLWQPGILPPGQAFLITGIRLFGITTPMLLGIFQLVIYHKEYGLWPAWSLALRERRYEFEPLVIPANTTFQARLEWEKPPVLGHTHQSGFPFQLVQCFLRGYKVRPVQ